MPAVLAPVIASAAASAGIAISTTAATIAAYAITTAAAIGLSFLLQPKKEKGDPSQVQVKQALPPRRRGYGAAKLGGAVFFMETNGGALYQGLVHCEGPIDAVTGWWLNDKNAAVNPSSGLVGALPWSGYVTIKSAPGTPTQGASSMLTGPFPGIWTADHRLQGLCYSIMRCGPVKEKHFQKVYPNGVPQLRIEARLSKCYDPRNEAHRWEDPNTWAWSDNPGICILDFLTHPRGFALPKSRINVLSFWLFADLCDQAVPLKAGGAELRYRIGGTYDLTEEPREVLRRMLATCDGELYTLGDGTIGIRGGQWEEPTVTLTEAHLLGYEYEQGNDKLAAFNCLKLTYTSPLHDYQPVETEAWEDLANQEEAGEVLTQDLTLDMVPLHGQARRLGKIAMHKGNPRHRLRIRTTLAGLQALGERTVRLRIAELNLDTTFLIEAFEIASDMVSCHLSVVSLGPEAYAWDPLTEEGTPPPLPQDTSVATVPPTPTGVALTLVRTQITGGTWTVAVRATATPLADPSWETIGRIRKQGASTWTNMVDDGDWAVKSEVLEDGATYEVQLAHAGFGGADTGSVGARSAIQTIVATADPTPPAAPSGLGASVSGSSVTLSWTNPGSSNFYATRVYRGTTTNFAQATLVGTVYGAAGMPGSFVDTGRTTGTWRYWVAAINRSGTPSSPSAMATAVV